MAVVRWVNRLAVVAVFEAQMSKPLQPARITDRTVHFSKTDLPMETIEFARRRDKRRAARDRAKASRKKNRG